MLVSLTNPSDDNSALCQRLLRATNVLFVGAHPDDIEFYSAALVYMLRDREAHVTFAIATRGGRGRAGEARARLEGLRTKHQMNAARILGGVTVVMHDYPDKELANHTQDFAKDLKALISQAQPEIVFSWDPQHIYNPHPDHRAAAGAAQIAISSSDCSACCYGTREPNVWLGHGDKEFAVKLRSIRAHRTETPWPYSILVKRHLARKSRAEGRKIGCKYAEIYRWIEPVGVGAGSASARNRSCFRSEDHPPPNPPP